jgi:hypothetical protein
MQKIFINLSYFDYIENLTNLLLERHHDAN